MTTCKWTSNTTPRILPGRHLDECADRWSDDPNGCWGCLPCTEPHCRVCGRVHAEGACAECLAATRADLHEIARLCDALPDEVEHRGVDGEAMMLLGPSADWEARGHLEASVRAGRVPPEYLETADSDQHPLFVLGGWDAVWRDALDHDEPAERLTLTTATDYLDRQIGYMATYPHVPFEDFARDLRRCRAHLEAVLTEGEQTQRGVPCMTCGATLVRPAAISKRCKHPTPARQWLATLRSYPEIKPHGSEIRAAREACGDCDQGGRRDAWECPRCKQTSTEDQYRFAVQHIHREEATHLTDRDVEIRTGIRAGTVRVWANRGDVEKRRDGGRTVYCVADVIRVGKERGLVAQKLAIVQP